MKNKSKCIFNKFTRYPYRQMLLAMQRHSLTHTSHNKNWIFLWARRAEIECQICCSKEIRDNCKA